MAAYRPGSLFYSSSRSALQAHVSGGFFLHVLPVHFARVDPVGWCSVYVSDSATSLLEESFYSAADYSSAGQLSQIRPGGPVQSSSGCGRFIVLFAF